MTFATVLAPGKNLARIALTVDRAADIAARFWTLELFEEADSIVERLEL